MCFSFHGIIESRKTELFSRYTPVDSTYLLISSFLICSIAKKFHFQRHLLHFLHLSNCKWSKVIKLNYLQGTDGISAEKIKKLKLGIHLTGNFWNKMAYDYLSNIFVQDIHGKNHPKVGSEKSFLYSNNIFWNQTNMCIKNEVGNCTVRNFCIKLPLYVMEVFFSSVYSILNTFILKNTHFYLNFNTHVYIDWKVIT